MYRRVFPPIYISAAISLGGFFFVFCFFVIQLQVISVVVVMADQKFSRGDSKKKLAGDVRRNRFKDRGKDLERGVSTPALFSVGAAAPKAPLPLNEDEVVTVGQGMGHQFVKKTFFHAAHCQHCSEILWGIRGQGYICEGNFRSLSFYHIKYYY